MYEALKTKISREQFNLDVKLATLNEYIEFVEAEEDEDGWYLELCTGAGRGTSQFVKKRIAFICKLSYNREQKIKRKSTIGVKVRECFCDNRL